MAEAGSAGADRDDPPVGLQRHSAGVEIELADRPPLVGRCTKKAEEPLSATVSAKLIFHSAMRLSTISIAAWTDAVAAATASAVVLGIGKRCRKHQRDFGLALGLDDPAPGPAPAVGDAHVIEQHAEIGLVDAKLRLHGLRGEPDLATDDAPALRLPGPVLSAWIA